MKSNEIAKILGINKATLHRYEKAGKIKKPSRNKLTNHRIYDEEYLEYVKRVINK